MKVKISAKDRELLKEVFPSKPEEKSKEDIFYDLCYCICAPQAKAKANQEVNYLLRHTSFYNQDIATAVLEDFLKPVRFYRNKTKYLLEMKFAFDNIYYYLVSVSGPATERRSWLKAHVKGLGMKAASHFMRCLGDMELAIIDTHICKFLNCRIPKNNYEYMKLEFEFRKIAKKNKLSVAELDILLWCRYASADLAEIRF